MSGEQKTYVGVISTHDDKLVNDNLVSTFEALFEKDQNLLRKFHFIFTGGTFDRVIQGKEPDLKELTPATREYLIGKCGVSRLPSYKDGGITFLSYFVTQRLCSVIWQFFSPRGYHWRTPENLAHMRLGDQWHVKRLMNKRSVEIWFDNEAVDDVKRNIQDCPPILTLRDGADSGEVEYRFGRQGEGWHEINAILEIDPDPKKKQKSKEGKVVKSGKLYTLKEDIIEHVHKTDVPEEFGKMTVALIAHDDMKKNMIAFAIDHEWELEKFGTILATGTTGREVMAATSRLHKKIYRYNPGPKGGDIEIATEILLGRCHIVIFFVDPLNPHPHIDDIRTVFIACMNRDNVLVMTNEMHAREFLTRVVRGNSKLGSLKPEEVLRTE